MAVAGGTGGGAGADCCFGYEGRVGAAVAVAATGTFPAFALRRKKQKTQLATRARLRMTHENGSRGEVSGTGGKRVHDSGGVGSSHPRHKRRSTLLCHLVFTP